MNIDTAIFLGAGASRAEGAPLQNEIFFEYFTSPAFRGSHDEMDRELATFFLLMFGVDVDCADLRRDQFPTFEEALALTDIAILRKESFKHFDIENRAVNSGRLRFIAQYLVFMVAKLLDERLRDTAHVHRKLVNTLYGRGIIKKVAFLSTNYDILIDNVLTELYDKNIDLDYGIEFKNFNRNDDWREPRKDRRVFLFKPHGSLNWLYCPTCNSIEITPKEKGVVTRLISDFRQASCTDCGSVFTPIIVPPSFYKDLNNIFLSTIWNKSEHVLRDVEHIMFCGYSFPDADMHIKYLLKRIQINRRRKLRFSVINYFDGKSVDVCKEEEYRYKRFLGDAVRYRKISFEEFADNPIDAIKY